MTKHHGLFAFALSSSRQTKLSGQIFIYLGLKWRKSLFLLDSTLLMMRKVTKLVCAISEA